MRSDRHKPHHTKLISWFNIILAMIVVVLGIYIGRDYLDVLPMDKLNKLF